MIYRDHRISCPVLGLLKFHRSLKRPSGLTEHSTPGTPKGTWLLRMYTDATHPGVCVFRQLSLCMWPVLGLAGHKAIHFISLLVAWSLTLSVPIRDMMTLSRLHQVASWSAVSNQVFLTH